MNVILKQQVPILDGYYLVRFGESSGLHLVLVQTELDGKRNIIADTGKKLFFNDFPDQAFWSEIVVSKIVQ
jgi:hypothetical protein